ncbi:MAG TPA: YjbE family putative metal transport protein [Stellaceae bacterium]|nr:YjbE family putative metal transport protein [Stellaceae bacterium]
MPAILSPGGELGALGAFLSVVIIDVVLAGDNAVVVGMAAAHLEKSQRRRAIVWGIVVATILRICLALIAVDLLAIIGLTLAGGLLLLWVAWKLYRDLAGKAEEPEHAAKPPSDSFRQALFRIVLADVSMSLDNVLAVAGTARNHIWVLVCGLTLSVALMGVASEVTGRLIARYRWIAWIGLAIVTGVALKMIYEGSTEVVTRLSGVGLSTNWVL